MKGTIDVVVLKGATVALRFLLEIGALIALGYWGFQLDRGAAARFALGLGAPLLAAIVWGAFAAPRAAVAVSEPIKLLVQVAVFGAAVAALAAAGRPALAAIFAAVAVVNAVLLYLLGQ